MASSRLGAAGMAGNAWPLGDRRDRLGRLDLPHQLVAPLALDLEMRGRPELDGFDHVVIDVAVDAGLQELVHCRARRAAAHQPGLLVDGWRICELSRLPHIIAMAADDMDAGIAVGL